MFQVTGAGQDAIDSDTATIYGLKPMNCPAHCLIYAAQKRSYRSLPLRLADFGTLHRNEVSGALRGLTRLRSFHQDDAHIFCRADQVADEVAATLDFLRWAYTALGFGDELSLALSTRPESYVGTATQWDDAEDALKGSLVSLGLGYNLNPGDGAFYGPKIDVSVADALGRRHQCATVQLDFQLPRRFELSYDDEAGEAQHPVMIHRALLGSVERMMAMLAEHHAGRWPLWLSPRQVCVCTVGEAQEEYANAVAAQLRQTGLFVDVDATANTVKKKVREAQVAQYNYILVVGEKETEAGTVHVRLRDGSQVVGAMAVRELLERVADDLVAFR